MPSLMGYQPQLSFHDYDELLANHENHFERARAIPITTHPASEDSRMVRSVVLEPGILTNEHHMIA